MSQTSATVVFNVPATEWVVVHNLGKFVSSDVFIFDGQGAAVKCLPKEVVHTSTNQLTVKFSTPQTGLVKVL